jgi:uncharacterized membrane protein
VRAAKRREEYEVEFGRIVAFSDGVFAIAITLLVLNLGIKAGLPKDQVADALWEQRENFVAFAISFAVIGRFWVVHHRFFGEVHSFDGRLITLNLLYLGSIVLIPFSSEVLGKYGGQTPAVVLYSVNLAIVVLVGLAMGDSARRRDLTSTDEEAHRETRARTAFIAGIFLLSVPLAFVAPSVAPYLWLALFFDPTTRLATRSVSRGGR